MTRPLGRRLAVNPIPYWSRGGRIDKSPAVFDEAFADLARIGFTAVKADVPDGMNAADYLDWIGSYGLTPALSPFNSPSMRPSTSPKRSSMPRSSRPHRWSSVSTGP